MNTHELAAATRERFPDKADAIVSFFGPMFEWDVVLRPYLPDLTQRAKRAVFWTEIQDVIALDSGDVSVPGPAQEIISSALGAGFRDAISNVFGELKVPARGHVDELDAMAKLLDPLFQRMHKQIGLVLGMAFDGDVPRDVVDTIQKSIISALQVAAMCAASLIFSGRAHGAETFRPFLQIYIDGNLPVGIDAVTQTLVVLVGERPTVLEYRP